MQRGGKISPQILSEQMISRVPKAGRGCRFGGRALMKAEKPLRGNIF
jgi:hypothetical protein